MGVRLRSRARVRLLVSAARVAPVCGLAPLHVAARLQRGCGARPAVRAAVHGTGARAAIREGGGAADRGDRGVGAGRAHQLALDDRALGSVFRLRLPAACLGCGVLDDGHAVDAAAADRGGRGVGDGRGVSAAGEAVRGRGWGWWRWRGGGSRGRVGAFRRASRPPSRGRSRAAGRGRCRESRLVIDQDTWRSGNQTRRPRRRSEFTTTEIDDAVIAKAANMGLMRMPKKG